MARARDDSQRSLPPSQGFVHRRRSLGAHETLPPKGDLLSQIIALSEEAKRLRAQARPEPKQKGDDEEDPDADAYPRSRSASKRAQRLMHSITQRPY